MPNYNRLNNTSVHDLTPNSTRWDTASAAPNEDTLHIQNLQCSHRSTPWLPRLTTLTNPDIKKAFLESLTCDWWAVNDERLRPTTVVTARSSVRVSSLGASFPFYGTNDRHRVVPSGGCVSDSIRRIVSFFPLVVEVGLNFSNVSQRITKADAKH